MHVAYGHGLVIRQGTGMGNFGELSSLLKMHCVEHIVVPYEFHYKGLISLKFTSLP